MYFKLLLLQAGLDAMPPGGTDKLLTGVRFLETELFREMPTIYLILSSSQTGYSSNS
jgi:hypothetical protein